MKRLPLILLTLFVMLSGCGKQLPPPLPVAPQLQPELLNTVWPAQEQNFRISGSLCIYSITLPVQGILSLQDGGKTVAIALLTQMGTSIFEAKIDADTSTMFTVSPMLKKHPQLEAILVRMVRAIYLPEAPTTSCASEFQENIAQLRCPEQQILHSFSVNPKNPAELLLRRRINAKKKTTVYLQNWQNVDGMTFPERVSYRDDDYRFTGKLNHLPLSSPLGITTEKN